MCSNRGNTDSMNASNRRVSAPPILSSQGEWRVVLGLVLLMSVMVGAVMFASRDAPSSRSNNPEVLAVPTITSDQGCASFSNYWIEQSGVRVEPATIEGLTNCRLSAGGEWFVPTGANDSRLTSESVLTEDEASQTASTRSAILAEVTLLEAQLSSSITRDLDRIYNTRTQAVTGRINDSETISRARSRYARVAQAFLLDPNHRILADYVGWLMQRKIAAYDALSSDCLGSPETQYLKIVCLGMEDSLSVNFPPWLWDLRSSVWLNEYLAHLARTDRIPDISTAEIAGARAALARSWMVRRHWQGIPS
jgi:hypothetical protein